MGKIKFSFRGCSSCTRCSGPCYVVAIVLKPFPRRRQFAYIVFPRRRQFTHTVLRCVEFRQFQLSGEIANISCGTTSFHLSSSSPRKTDIRSCSIRERVSPSASLRRLQCRQCKTNLRRLRFPRKSNTNLAVLFFPQVCLPSQTTERERRRARARAPSVREKG